MKAGQRDRVGQRDSCCYQRRKPGSDNCAAAPAVAWFLASLLWINAEQTLAAEPSRPIHIGSSKQLFFDDQFFASKRDVTLRMNPPVKAGQAITHTKPWEQGWIYASATFIEDNGVFKVWYTAQPPFTTPGEVPAVLCYAESKDAIHWEKPNLGLYEYAGSKANNIVLAVTLESRSVFIDPVAPPEQRVQAAGHHESVGQPARRHWRVRVHVAGWVALEASSQAAVPLHSRHGQPGVLR